MRFTAWIVVVAVIGCAAPDDHASHPAPDQQAAPSTVAGADATRPNRVLDPNQFSDPYVKRAYTAAQQVAHVLEEIYCYCKCKENIGHRALIECFESDHGANCDVCMTEALTAARMTQQGKTPKEIQKAIDAYYAG